MRTPTRRTRAQSVESHAKIGIVQSGVSQKSKPATEHVFDEKRQWYERIQPRRNKWWIHFRVERRARVVRSFAKLEESVGWLWKGKFESTGATVDHHRASENARVIEAVSDVTFTRRSG